MDVDMDPGRRLTSQMVEVRAQAGCLLERLYASNELNRQALEEAGGDDPIKTVTGRTALEEAINSTTDMIHQMDRLIGPSHGVAQTAAPGTLVEANPLR